MPERCQPASLRYCDQRGTYPYPHWLMATEQHCWRGPCRLSSLATLYGAAPVPGLGLGSFAQPSQSFSSTTQAFWQQETWWWRFKQSPDDLSAPGQWSLCSSPGGAMVRLPRGQPYLDGTLPGFFATTCDLWLACDSLFNHRNANTIFTFVFTQEK